MHASSAVQPARGRGARSGNRIRDRDQGEQQGDETAGHPRHVAHTLLIGLFAHVESPRVDRATRPGLGGLPGLPGSPNAKKFMGPILAREYPSVLLGFVRELVPPRSLAGGGRGMLASALPLRSIEALLLNATTVNA